MASKIFYKESVYKDLKKINKKTCAVILNKIEKYLKKVPPDGKPLARELKGMYSYRSGDYRVIYTKIPEGVLVLRIGHRKDVYE